MDARARIDRFVSQCKALDAVGEPRTKVAA
jgi:hypothetical protein